jgi:hypothetical protein
MAGNSREHGRSPGSCHGDRVGVLVIAERAIHRARTLDESDHSRRFAPSLT